MPREDAMITTGDGQCPAAVFTPTDGVGPWPGTILFMDGLGIRPALHDMGQRLADAGYVVLLPDLFYRHGPYEPLDPEAVLGLPRCEVTSNVWCREVPREDVHHAQAVSQGVP